MDADELYAIITPCDVAALCDGYVSVQGGEDTGCTFKLYGLRR